VVATATDGSGYSINANPSATGSVTIALTTSSGKSLSVPQNAGNGSAKTTDRNGNEISTDGSGNFYDTLSSTAATLVVSGTGTVSSPQKFTYTTSTGGSAYYQVNYTNYTVATNFGISGITEYKSAAAVPLVTGVELPDTSQYTFTYETTPGTCAPYSGTTCVTARLKTVTLPTGGMITYTYSGGYDGIFSDGSAAGLMRQTPDGTWTYNRTLGTGSNVGASATLITAPMLSYETNSDQTIEQFQGIYPTQTDVYQGTAPSFSSVPISQGSLQTSGLLQETQTCYNGSANPCTAAPITAAISQRTVATNVAGGTGNLWSEHTDQYNAYGLQTLSEDYDFAATAPGPVLQQTTTSYAALGGSLNAFVQTVEVLNAAGTIQSRQDTTYDQYGSGMGCVTGAPQHDDTDFGCSFTARGNATSVTTYTNPSAPSGGITKNFTYDSTGNLLTAQVNCCELKTWTYLPSTSYAYATSVTSGSSSPQMTTTSTYDLHMGLVLTTTDPNSLTTTMTYDKMGRPLTTAVGTNPATVYTYSDTTSPWTALVCSPVQGTATACQKTVMDSQGRTATIQLLDASSNLYSATDTKYDSWGRAYRVSNPYTGSAAYWTQTNTDALGRTVKSTLQDGSVGASSYTNNTVTTTDPAGKQREGVFDGLGRLTTVYEPDPTNGNSLTLQTSYTYNVFNQLTQVTQGSQTRTYVYDALARLNSSTTPEAGAICLGTYSGSTCQANGYDGWNNLLYRTDARGVVTNYMYDTLNRLVGITYPTVPSGVTPMPNVCEANGATSNNANVCLNYGTSATSYNNGLPMSMTDGSGSESYTYNSLEQISQLQKVIGTTTYTSSYAYNYADELTQITYPSGRVVAQTFDAIGRVCAVGASGSTCSTGTTYATGYTYNAAQQPTAFNYGNTVAASFGYSPDRLQLTSLSYAKSGTSLFALAYSYGTSGSNDGLTSSITDSVQPGRSVSYTYDSLARLSTALTTGSTAYPQWGLSWTYDRYANRTVQRVTAGTGVPSNTVTISASTNQITGSPYTYDASGNMTNDGLNTLVYDAENRTTSATNGSSSGAYTYDGGGLRIKKVAGSIATVYVFSGTKVIAEYDNGAAPTAPSREYVYSGTTLLAKFDSTGTHYYHKDVLSNRVVTDSGGNVYEQLGHYPYGESWYNASNDKLFFTSYERDSESGNDYAQARYYVSRLGRFSSTDPLAGNTGDPQSLNRYVYGRDLPVILVDPSGQDGDCPQETRRKRWIDREDFGGGMVLFPSEMEEIFAAQDPTGICGGGGGGDVGGGDDPPTVDNGNPPIPPPEPESGCPPGADSCVTVSGTDPLADCAGNIGACMASIDEELVTGSGGGNSALGLLKLALQKANCAALLGGSAKAAQLLAHFNGTTMVSPNTKYSDQNTAQAQNVLYGPQQQNPGGATTPVPDGGNFQNGNWATTGGFTTYFGNVASGYSPSAQATVLVHEFMHAGSTGSTIETAAIDMVTPNVPGQQKSNITANIYQIQKNCGTALPPGY
jgi:RHS repeat-associated protein